MVFEHPQILFGLFLLGIPLLIHFLNFRRTRTIYFSSLKFLHDIEASHRSRKNLRDLLLLLLRLLVFACVLFAFSKPVKRSKNELVPRKGIVGIFIDNSESMGIPFGEATVLEAAKNFAKTAIQSYPPDQKFFLLSNDNRPQHQGISDAGTAIEKVSGLEPVVSTTSAARILQNLTTGADRTGEVLSGIWFISDFCKNAFTIPLPPDSSGIQLFPVIIREDSVPNIGIDSCWFTNPIHRIKETSILTVSIRNFGSDNLTNLPVRLIVNDTLRNEILISLPALGNTQAEIPFTINSNGWQKGRVAISDYPYEPDNELFFAFSIAAGIPVLQLFGDKPNRFFSALFTNDPYYKYDEYPFKGFPRTDFSEYNMVVLTGIRSIDPVLSERLKIYLDQGGTVWFFPELNGEIQNYNEFLSSLRMPVIQSVNLHNQESATGPALNSWLETVIVNPGKQLRLPAVSKFFDFGGDQPERIDILTTVGGRLLVSQFPIGNGRFILNAFPLAEEAGDLMYHPIFIPLTMRLASVSSIDSHYYHILGSGEAAEINISLDPAEGVIKLEMVSSGNGLVPEIKSGPGGNSLIFTTGIQDPGFYVLTQNEQILHTLALNVSREESDLAFEPDSLINMHFATQGWQVSDIKKTDVNNTPGRVESGHSGKSLWHLFLIAALIFLVIESFVMQRKK
ncbi:MAG: hypothetical protein A2X22_04340 [Bacteroidetes bacterium GWF2_49_14]|nr:MAG: hypothetical protein A2X22_04340 [Bacteroidetes bacterium GWF2_49_14]HBB92705.1 hypothetical protein [Bacteroidales bacterium]